MDSLKAIAYVLLTATCVHCEGQDSLNDTTTEPLVNKKHAALGATGKSVLLSNSNPVPRHVTIHEQYKLIGDLKVKYGKTHHAAWNSIDMLQMESAYTVIRADRMSSDGNRPPSRLQKQAPQQESMTALQSYLAAKKKVKDWHSPAGKMKLKALKEKMFKGQ